jgi:tRNASer (uridine44-2'-O)-methyltransferase
LQFEPAVLQLVHHPEYNSTLILRSELLVESRDNFPPETPDFRGFLKVNCIHRKLLPRRPGRDDGLEQYCTLYSRGTPDPLDVQPDTLVFTPITLPGSKLPYYHPAVFHIAFRYLCSTEHPPSLRIEVLPIPGTPRDPNSRLYRTCLALLETLHRYGWGAMVNYKKRVLHDQLVPRDQYQDMYLVMRERHKHLVDSWQEVTDPLKHVFEDIAIATFLMLFWKETYTHLDLPSPRTSDPDRPWTGWPRPPGGFLDFG